MKNRKNYLLLLVLGLALACTSIAGNVPKSIPPDPALRMGRLPNGFKYYIRHNGWPQNRVTMYLVNNVGSILESEDQRGLAHFMEHMNFNGTVHFPKNELVNYLQKAGLKFGADINAHTTFDETVYQLPLPADKPDVLRNGLQIIRDWAQEATLDPVEIDKERGVVLEEERLRKGIGSRIQQQTLPVFLKGSLYSERIPIGVDTVLKYFKPEAIRRFYHDWYRPDLQAIVVVGDIDVDAFEKMIKEKFSDLKNPAGEKPRTTYTIPLSATDRYLALTDPEAGSASMQIDIKRKGLVVRTDSDFSLQTVRGLFVQMLNDRLARLNREADPPYDQARVGISPYLGGLDDFNMNVGVRPGQLERGVKAFWAEVQKVLRFGFTQAELDRAKTAMLDRMEVVRREKDKLPSKAYADAYQALFLKGEAAPGVDWEYSMTKTYLSSVSLAAVNALAADLVRPEGRDIVVLLPEREKSSLPTEGKVKGWLRQVEDSTLAPYIEETNTRSLLSDAPAPGKVIERSMDTAIGIVRLTLSNGLKVVLKPTKFSNDQILFRGNASGGTSLAPDIDYPSAAYAGILIPSAGVGNYDATQLTRYLQGKQAAVAPYIQERSEGMSGAATTESLETVLQLIYAYFTEPRKDATVFRNAMSRTRESLLHRQDNPTSVFSDTVDAVLGNHNIRRMAFTDKMLDQVDLDKAYAFYKQCFSDASAFTFTFVGNIDTTKMIPLLERYLGSLPYTDAGQTARDLGIRVPEGKITKYVYKGMEDKSKVDLLFGGNFEYTARNLVQLTALKEILQIRMIERLREEESGVYSPSVQFLVTKYPVSWYGLRVSFTCAPSNSDKLVASVLDELKKLRTEGPPSVDLDKWKANDKSSRELQLKSNGWWLGYISGQIENGNDLRLVEKHEQLVGGESVSDLQQAAAKFLSGENFIRFELRPEEKK